MEIIQGAKYLWQLPSISRQSVLDKSLEHNLSFAVMQTLVNRGYLEKDDINNYLFTGQETVSNPSLLKDAQKAVDRILQAIKNKEKILICGDYDVDGVTSSAMMLTCLLPLGANINFFLPHRVKDGYGLSAKTVERAAQNGYKVLITVDNGITAFDAANCAQKLGIDLIITDHHKPHDHLPSAFAVIDPHQNDCSYPYKKFAGVGVTFKILSLLYEKIDKKLPVKVYELLLLGTVADVVPLTGENRYWVRHGLQMVNQAESLALRVLKKNSKCSKPTLSSLDIGFFLAPQINALGRLEDARDAVKFLIGSDELETERIGFVLHQLNEARKSIEKSVFSQIQDAVENKKIDLENERIILYSSNEWQPGIIGLVASRVVGAYNRPAILLHLTSSGLAKGSCRSTADFNMFEALNENKDLLTSFGGHAMAAGLSLPIENLPQLKKRLEEFIWQKIPVFDPKPKIRIDAELSLTEANKKLMDDLAYLEPFGNENEKPLFFIKDATLVEPPMLLKDVHVKCLIFSEGIIKPVIFFNRPDLYDILLSKAEENISIAAYVTENHFNGKISIELQGLDIAI